MGFDQLIPLILALITILIVFYGLEKFLNVGSQVQVNRLSHPYQGGEIIDARERRYASRIFIYVLFYLILHVLGFLWGTSYSLLNQGKKLLNVTTTGFGIITLYIILMIKSTKEVILSH